MVSTLVGSVLKKYKDSIDDNHLMNATLRAKECHSKFLPSLRMLPAYAQLLIEQLYQAGGGELLLQFLPEKEANLEDGEGEEMEEGEEPEDDEVTESAAAKAEWSAYMDSYVQVPAAQRPCGREVPVRCSGGGGSRSGRVQRQCGLLGARGSPQGSERPGDWF